MCGGLILSLQHHICINRQLWGVKLGVCGCVEGDYHHFNITYASTVNYVGGCMGVWRVNIITSTSHMCQPSTMLGRTGGVCVCGGLISSLQHHKPSTMWRQTGGVWVNTVTITSHMH